MGKRGTVWAGLCLALCLTLCGCVAERPASAGEDAAPAPVPTSIPGRAAGIMEDETLLTVDGRGVPAWEYLYWLSLACDRARGQPAPDWEGVREQALMNAALYKSVEALAERCGVAAGADDESAVAERWRRRCAAYGGEGGYLEEIARYGLNRERAEALFRVGLLYGKLRELCAEGGAFSPDAAELEKLSRESGEIVVDRILCADGDRAAAKRRAEALFSQLNGASNQAALFSELTWEGSDHKGPRTLKGGVFPEKLARAARELQIGQISGIIEADDGFSILRRLPPERESLLETWLRHTVEEAARAADVELSERCASLDVAAFSAALETLRNAP
ncbi:MAG: peptidylprolyl isomerase [Oscillibacter sp.]|nr:peptidylprolyl isomerase [Oscillibacter sp.]